jgi:tetratricopeptide (TPR) repeat protein
MSGRRRCLLLLACGTSLLALGASAGLWWYSISRPDYRLRQGQEALRRGNGFKAEQTALQLEADGYNDHAHLLSGEIYFRQQHYVQAVHEFNKLQDQGNLRREAVALSGRCFLSLGNRSEAARAFRFVLSEDPEHLEAHRGLAAVYYDQGAVVSALHHLFELARLDGTNGQAHRLIGLIYKDRPYDNQLAIAAYQEALRRELSPEVAEAVREELAACLVKQSDYAQALQILDGCTAEGAAQPAVVALRANCLWSLGQASQACALLDQALPAYPQSVELLRLRAQLHLDAREPEASLARLEQALQIDRHDFVSRHLLAQTYDALGRRTEADEQRRLCEQTQADFKTLTQLSEEVGRKPWDASLHQRLAEVCEKLNKPELAAMWRQAAAACPQAKN